MKSKNNRLLGNTNIKIFPIGLGAMPLSIDGRPDENTAKVIIQQFVEKGGNFIDTANVYGLDINDAGHNEKLIYTALKEMNCIDSVIVASKGGATRPNGGWGIGAGRPDELRKACEQSLLFLNRESHPLYYLHGPDPKVPLEDSMGELVRLKKEGKIQHIGICNVDLDQIKLACNLTPLIAVQNRCNPFCKADINNGVLDYCMQHQINYIPYCPVGGWATHRELTDKNCFKHFIEKYHVSAYTISLSWLLHHSKNIIPIPGMDKIAFITDNFKATAIKLSTEDINKINDFPDLFEPAHKEPIQHDQVVEEKSVEN